MLESKSVLIMKSTLKCYTSTMKIICVFLIFFIFSNAIEINEKPIEFDTKRIELTKQYIKQHYNLNITYPTIIPKIIIVHHTGINDFDKSFKRFIDPSLPLDRPDIIKAGALNVSTHFMIDVDGTIYRLMDETMMARHVIGLNYSSIGIENVGGENFKDNLTKAQLLSNIELIKYLKNEYATIKYLVAHYEYQNFENHTLWLEKDASYRTIKHDPSKRFMKELRFHIKDLALQ